MKDYVLKDVKRVFSEAIADLMAECGITRDKYDDEEIASFVHACVNYAYDEAWAEFMAWVQYGDDKKQRTLALIRLNRSSWRA